MISDRLGVSLSQNFIWNSALSLMQAGVFIYGFTQGGTDGLTLTATGSLPPLPTPIITTSGSKLVIHYGEPITITVTNAVTDYVYTLYKDGYPVNNNWTNQQNNNSFTLTSSTALMMVIM